MSALQTIPTSFSTAANGIRFAYRRIGSPSPITQVPLVCHIHFRANMDHWDPLFINTLASRREVIVFDNAGVGRSAGSVPTTFQGWANDLILFVNSVSLAKFDLLGFSMGGIAVQYVAMIAPQMVRKLVVAGSRAVAPIVWRGVKPGSVKIVKDEPPAEPIRLLKSSLGTEAEKKSLCYSFFPDTRNGKLDFEKYWERLNERRLPSEPLNLKLLDKDGGARNQLSSTIKDTLESENPSVMQEHGDLSIPVLVANGDNDVLIPTSRSWELFTKVDNVKLIIYPEAGHGFIWQYAEQFGQDVNRFLNAPVTGLDAKL